MQTSKISFKLFNGSETDATIILIPASIYRGESLAGKYLAAAGFNDVSGVIAITVSDPNPATAIADLMEVTNNDIVEILSASVFSDSFLQARQPFTCRKHKPFAADENMELVSYQTLGSAQDQINISFLNPFKSTRDCSLLYKLAAGQSAMIELTVGVPDYSASNLAPVAPPASPAPATQAPISTDQTVAPIVATNV